MSMEDLSTFCSLHRTLSSIVHISPYRGHLSHLLHSFIGIWYFWGIVNGIVFIYSFSIWSLFVYRNQLLLIFPSWFCILLLCWSCLWCLVVLGWCFSVFNVQDQVSHVQIEIVWLLICIPVCIPFISSSCLIALTRSYRTMLNRSGDSGHTCLVLEFRGNGFSFSPLSIMLAIGLSYTAFIMLSYIPSILSFLKAFIIMWCWILLKAFSASMRWSCGFCLCFY
jgi:hypothetical protein